MPFGPASLLGVERFSEESEAPLELIPGDEDARKEQIIRAVYKQVLGNAYVMDSERQIVEESQFKLGEISVRELVGRIAKSDLYRSRFFDNCARYRYIELAFRHLLGRAPADYAEMREHADRLDSQGYEADIDSFLNSSEYQNTFGEWTVPYQRGWKTESCLYQLHILGCPGDRNAHAFRRNQPERDLVDDGRLVLCSDIVRNYQRSGCGTGRFWQYGPPALER